MVASAYKDVMASVPYVLTHIWNGHWQDLEGAIKLGKREYDEVVVPQTYGKTVAISHTESSFQLDQWKRAGELHNWDKLPLTINRPTNEKDIVSRIMGSRPTILFADHSESSPAPFADRLCALLEREFSKTHQIVRLSTVRLEKFCDCIALYDAADAVIVTETAHLHLSKATKTPVFALATDSPSRWHGSAWSSRFRFYCRYGQYELMESELLNCLRATLDGSYQAPNVTTFQTGMPFGYNPSLITV